MIYTHVLNRGGKGSSALLTGCDAVANGDVGGEDDASSYGKNNVTDEFRVESLMTLPCYTAG